MFSFFTKKEYLVDYLEGFIDIHNHILPGIDDGAKNVEESIELIKGFGEFGVRNFICTPHIMENYYPNTPETIKNSLALLQNDLKKNNLDHVKIAAAAEHMIDSNFETILEKGLLMPLTENYLLVEMSYLQPSINFDDAVIKISENNFFPILAHPERYIYLHQSIDAYTKFKSKGMLFQLNLLSLDGFYGKDVQRIALKLLEENMIDFVASDVHNRRQLTALKKITLNKERFKKIVEIIEKTSYNFV